MMMKRAPYIGYNIYLIQTLFDQSTKKWLRARLIEALYRIPRNDKKTNITIVIIIQTDIATETSAED